MSDAQNPRYPKIIAGFLALVITGAVATGLYVTGGPEHQRLKRLDEKRLSQLNEIKYKIENFYTRQKHLPKTMAELTDSHNPGSLKPEDSEDPQTGTPLEYAVTDETHYKLCAVFDTSNQKDSAGNQEYPYYRSSYGPSWKHSKGHYCFRLDTPENPHLKSTP